MTPVPSTVGVLGATGAVGREVVRFLAATAAQHRVLTASRHLDPGAKDAHRVDVNDYRALATFCAACDIVINCSGPSRRTTPAVLAATAAAGTDLIDVGGGKSTLIESAAPGQRILLDAGFMPGLTALAPRWLAQQFETVTRLDGFAGGRELLTPAAAVDFAASLATDSRSTGDSDQPSTVWRHGGPVRVPDTRDDPVPGFPPDASAQLVLTSEAAHLAQLLSPTELRWHLVFDGALAQEQLGSVATSLAAGTPLEEAAERLRRINELDLTGRARYQRIVVDIEGELASGEAALRRLVVGTSDSYRTSAAFAAALVPTIVSGEVPPGIHAAGEAASLTVADTLQRVDPATSWSELAPAHVDEGAL